MLDLFGKKCEVAFCFCSKLLMFLVEEENRCVNIVGEKNVCVIALENGIHDKNLEYFPKD